MADYSPGGKPYVCQECKRWIGLASFRWEDEHAPGCAALVKALEAAREAALAKERKRLEGEAMKAAWEGLTDSELLDEYDRLYEAEARVSRELMEIRDEMRVAKDELFRRGRAVDWLDRRMDR